MLIIIIKIQHKFINNFIKIKLAWVFQKNSKLVWVFYKSSKYSEFAWALKNQINLSYPEWPNYRNFIILVNYLIKN